MFHEELIWLSDLGEEKGLKLTEMPVVSLRPFKLSLYFLMNLFVFNCPPSVAECILLTVAKRAALLQIFLLVLFFFFLNNTNFPV